jgi:hypothetical protein
MASSVVHLDKPMGDKNLNKLLINGLSKEKENERIGEF